MSYSTNYRFVKKSILGMLTGSALFLAACNATDRSSLRVAGGTIDGSDGNSKYPATVYVELKGNDFNNQGATIRNVGSLVDVGLGDSYALIFSLADVFQASNGVATLPIMKEVNIKLYMSSGQDEIDLPALKMSAGGFLQDQSSKSYFMLTVGVKAQKTGPVDAMSEQKINAVAQKVFMESPLMTEKGVNLRDANTSFVMIAVPKSAHPSLAALKVPSILAAEDRPSAAGLKGVVVGFGENTVGGAKKNEFALSPALPSVMKRNYADIEALNTSPAEYTPLRQLIGSASAVAQQVWEFTGSGLCGSKDGSNYDTGAAVYIGGKFAGFSVRSTAKSAGFKGKLDCASTDRSDMVTLVVSPSKDQIAQFVSRAKK
jgi:hypothetical protein